MRNPTSAERAVRRAVNPLSTAITMFVQTAGRPHRRAMASARSGRGSGWVFVDGPPGGEEPDEGGAGVREPRRPLPTHPSASASLELPD